MENHFTNVIRKQEKRSLSANPANIFERFEARRQEDLNLYAEAITLVTA